MAIRKIERDEWQSFFETFSKMFLKDEQPEYAELQILSDESGAQPATQWLILEGLTYNPREDILDIKLEDLDRLVRNPTEIYVDEDEGGWITSMEIVERDGTRDLIEIR